MKTLRIATRKSPLALWQAEHVARLLRDIGADVEVVPLLSGGDTDMRPIDSSRQVGVFTKRIQQALIDDEADIAVHSLKDLPTEVDQQLLLAAVPAIISGETGILVPAKNAAALAAAIGELLGDDERLRELGQNARAMVEARFDIRDITEQQIGIYRELGLESGSAA